MAITYPVTLDSLQNPTSSDTLNSPSHSGQHSDVNDAIEAIEAKMGADSSAVNTSLDYLIKSASSSNPGHKHTLAQGATDVTVAAANLVGTTDSQTLTNKTLSSGSVIDTNVTVTEILKKVYPIGSIYISVTSTNPATVFGFGTWSAFGAGKTIVGLDSGNTAFDTVEETGGAETVTLTSAQSGLPAHTHTQNAHTHTQDAHAHTVRYKQFTGISAGTGWILLRRTDGADSYDGTDSDAANSTTATNQNTTATNQNNAAANASSSHTNLQPYIVTYMFKRTA